MLLTDPKFIKQLEVLFLLARKVLSGELKADHKGDKKGAGINFADYAEYNLGDDYRSIDWNIYARLEQLTIKLFEVEEDLDVYILLDVSPSMQAKLQYATKLAAALGYIALNNADAVTIYSFADSLDTIMRRGHGRSRVFPMLKSLEETQCRGSDTRFADSLRASYSLPNRKGVCVVISDFLIPNGYVEGLNFLRWSKHDVFCIQVLDPAELTCPWKGDIQLECVETHERRNITITQSLAERFTETISQYIKTLGVECARREIGLASITISVPFEEIIQGILRRGGLVS